ncbi:uncharacterized protein LOC106693240 [Microplitis demolitor]|uniref:uncharacterized protein LOC106693240 n=1 Tax=Microplitis demolitor TaxID=69319 RepID=UPI0006D502B6|nr:uncharacterized protein LOC106693240 [Microplitis demolitor]
MLVWTLLLGLTTSLLVNGARPDPPASGITTVGSLKLANAEDCAGVVAFSAISGVKTDNQLKFSKTLVNRGVGYVTETGIFTTHCPGLYQFSAAGYGSADLKLTLKRKENKSDSWNPIVSTGTGGGSNLVLIDSEIGDQFAVFIDAGKSNEGTSFSGYRVAKK